MRTIRILSRIVVCASGILLLAAPALAGRFYRFERLSPKSASGALIGFSSICQDNDGFLWAGTSAGLARYDGYRFVLFSPSAGTTSSPPAVGFYPVTIARSGEFWIGTSGIGLLRFSPKTGGFVRLGPNARDPGSPGDDIVLAVQEDARGDLWVGTRRQGLSRYHRAAGSFERVPLAPGADVVWDVLADRKGRIWVGTLNAGLFRIDAESGDARNFRFDPADPSSLGSDTVWTVFEDHEGTIWAGTKEGGLNRYFPEKGRFARFYGAGDLPGDLAKLTITAIAEDRAGRLWLGTASDGLRIWDREQGEYLVSRNDPQDPESLGDDSVTSIFEDAGGVIWVGTVRGGLNKCLTGLAKFEHYKHDPSNPGTLLHDNVRAIWSDSRGDLWVGTKAGLERIEGTTGRTRRFLDSSSGESRPGEKSVLAVLGDPGGRVWLGTESGGLWRLDPGTGKVLRFRHDPALLNGLSNDKVNALWRDPSSPDVLWIGTHQGLDRFEAGTGRWTRFVNDPRDASSLSGNIIQAIHGDKAGGLWVGTRWGLNRLDRAAGKSERFIARLDDPPGRSISDNNVHAILEDRGGILWVGTDAGLDRLDRAKGEWKSFTPKDGLAGDIVCGILEDAAGALWISTNRGLSRFDPAAGVFRNFGVHEGLQGGSFNPGASFRAADGRMYFGGTNGFNGFAPAEVKADPFVPPVAWMSFRSNGVAAELPGTLATLKALELPYKAALGRFEFAALSFAAPELNTLVYRLEPRDAGWIPLDPDNSVSLSGLGAGEYTLRVRAANPDGLWNEEGFAIAIHVAAPFWRTWWFLSLAAVILACGAIAARALRKKIRSSSPVLGESLDAVIEAYDLTGREQEILRLVLQGTGNKDIERKLFISASTVRNHIYNIYQKLGVGNRLELINRIAKDARSRS